MYDINLQNKNENLYFYYVFILQQNMCVIYSWTNIFNICDTKNNFCQQFDMVQLTWYLQLTHNYIILL